MLPHNQNLQHGSSFNNLEFRRKQIDTLKIFNENVIEVSPCEEYCVHFMSSGRDMVLTVSLGGNFPNEKPNLMISPIVQHSWVNSQTGEIESAPGLLNYSAHSDLGRVVQAVVREFEKFPPDVIKNNHLTTSTIGLNSGNKNGSPCLNSLNSMKITKSLNSSKENLPLDLGTGLRKLSVDNNLPNLSNLSLDELKQLDTDPEFFDDFIEELSVVQQLNQDLDSMINQVEIISRENESKETNLVELKRKLSDDVTAIKNLGEKCDQLNKKYLKKSEEYEPQHIRELLQIAASNADTDCDHHVEQFLNGKIDVQTFLNSYTHSKKLSSERKAKEERLGQQLSALERAGI